MNTIETLSETPLPHQSDVPVDARRISLADITLPLLIQARAEHALVCVTQGEMLLHINSISYNATVGDIYFIQSGALMTITEASDDCAFSSIVFDLSAIAASNAACLAHSERLSNNVWCIDAYLGRNPIAIRELFDRLYRAVENPRAIGHELEACGLVLQLVGRLLQDGRWHSAEQLNEQDNRAHQSIRRVLSLIEENFAQDLTLADMAAAAEFSPNYFCRYFKKIAGCSPVEYLIDYRINVAAYQLITTEDSIADVALACGFNDASHFIKFFRRKKGVTPRRYRQLHLKNGKSN